MSSSNKLVYILNKDPQIELNTEKIEQNEQAIQNLNNDNLISVDLKSNLPYNVVEGTYAFVKNMGSVAEPKPGKPVYFHEGQWFDFCCPEDGHEKTAVADRRLEMVVLYAPNISSDMLLTEYSHVTNTFKNIKDNEVSFDVSQNTTLNTFLIDFYIRYKNRYPVDKNIGLYVTSDISGVDVSDYTLYSENLYAILPQLDGNHTLPSDSLISSNTYLALIQVYMIMMVINMIEFFILYLQMERLEQINYTI